MGMMFGPDEKVLTRGKMFAPAIPTPSHHGRAPGGRDGICIACHCLLLAVLMPNTSRLHGGGELDVLTRLEQRYTDAPRGGARRLLRSHRRKMKTANAPVVKRGRGLARVTYLMLKRASASRSSGEWSDEDFDDSARSGSVAIGNTPDVASFADLFGRAQCRC